MSWSVAGSYLQAEGTSQGAFFDVNTMKPLVNNQAFATALDVYKQTTKYAPKDELNLDVGDTRGLFTSGRCALSVDWGDIGTLAIDPKTSTVQDKVGAVIMPGSKKVLDRATRPTGRLRRHHAARTPSTGSTTRRSPPSAAGRARSTPPSTRRSRTPPTRSCPS